MAANEQNSTPSQAATRRIDMGAGAHFPSDLEAGRLVGTVAVQLLLQNPRFERDFATARATLRAGLKLAPEPEESATGAP